MYNIVYNKKIFLIIIVALLAIVIIGGAFVYFFVPKEKIIFFQKAEKPTPPADIPMSVLAPLDPDAEKAVIRVENFKP